MVSAEELDKYRDIPDMELPEYQALRQKLVSLPDEPRDTHAPERGDRSFGNRTAE